MSSTIRDKRLILIKKHSSCVCNCLIKPLQSYGYSQHSQINYTIISTTDSPRRNHQTTQFMLTHTHRFVWLHRLSKQIKYIKRIESHPSVNKTLVCLFANHSVRYICQHFQQQKHIHQSVSNLFRFDFILFHSFRLIYTLFFSLFFHLSFFCFLFLTNKIIWIKH